MTAMEGGYSASASPGVSSSAGPSTSTTTDHHTVLALLKRWRDNPNDEQVNSDAGRLAVDYLTAQDDVHWFCPQTSSATRDHEKKTALHEIALFCCRLEGFRASGKVKEWRIQLNSLLQNTCCACVRSARSARRDLGDRYLRRKFPEDHVQNWYKNLATREHDRILTAVESSKPSELLPLPLIYNILIDPALYASEPVLHALAERIDSLPTLASAWSSDLPLPPGLCLLLVCDNKRLRQWAFRLLPAFRRWTEADWSAKDDRLPAAVLGLLDLLNKRDRQARRPTGQVEQAVSRVDGVSITDAAEAFWPGLVAILGFCTTPVLINYMGGGGDKHDIVRLISGHLGDTGSHWTNVLRSFRYVTERLELATWNNLLDRKGKGRAQEDSILIEDDTDLGYIGARLYDILDNDAYTSSLSELDKLPADQRASAEDALFGWILPFVRSIKTSTFFGPCFTIITAKFLDDFGQKSHFDKGIRARCIDMLLRNISPIFVGPWSESAKAASRSPPNKVDWPGINAAIRDLDKHAAFLVRLAFKQEYTQDLAWADATRSARRFIALVAGRDATALRNQIYKLAELWRSKKPAADIPDLQVSDALVKESADAFHTSISGQGIGAYATAISIAGHLTRMSGSSWTGLEKDKPLRNALKATNEMQEKLFSPVATMLRLLADEDVHLIKRVLDHDRLIESIVQLILCPNEALSTAAQSVVRAAYDTTSRLESFRALFLNHAESALNGVILSLRAFKDSAVRLPEACGHAKRLVRCLTDVISVLCDKSEPLIRDDKWLEQGEVSRLIGKLWDMMCVDISIILERVEHWSVAFENNEMTEWMRDALTFVRELLDDVRTFESAVTGGTAGSQEGSPAKLTSRGRQMIESLSDPLSKLAQWLRITDRDLLELTTALMVSMLQRFARSEISVNKEVVDRIRRLAKKFQDPKQRKEQMLRVSEMNDLIAALAKHPELKAEFSNMIILDHKSVQQAKLNKLTSGNKSKAENDPIDIDSDDSDAVVVVSTSKTNARPAVGSATTKGEAARAKALDSRDKLNGKGRSSSTNGNGMSKSVPPGRGVSKPKSVPSRMPMFSHADMLARRQQSDSDDGEDWTANQASGLAKAIGMKTNMPSAMPRKADGDRKTKLLEPVQRATQQQSRRGQRIMTAADIQQQSQQKSKMRYNPDFTDLHRTILQWNVTQQGSLPTTSFRYARSIPQHFEGISQYIGIFLPLLLLEIWNDLATARDELLDGTSETETVSGALAGRSSVDDFTELFFSVARVGERSPYGESDVVLLRGPTQLLGKVHSVHRKQQKLDIVVRVHLGGDDGSKSRTLMNGSNWTIIKLVSLGTAHREYAALMSLAYYELMDEILLPPHRTRPEYDDHFLERAMAAYRVNRPQAAAIVSALSASGFSLIQGPPGTGKTKTILGLVGAFLSSRGPRATAISAGMNGGEQAPAEKILLCAPSNAAVDEVAKRLKDGVYNSEGKKISPNVVRIGADSAINVSVSDIFLDNMVERELAKANGHTGSGDSAAKMAAARTEMAGLKAERDEKRQEKANIANNTALLAQVTTEISALSRKIDDLAEKLDRERDRMTQTSRQQEAAKRQARSKILSEADVICATLSGSGHEYLAPYDFETVIIDEAAQSVEISSLIPLKYNCARCIMVGDPNQLPPTVKSREATNAGYNTSLFVRLHQSAPEATHLLSIQYRMHPDISAFPSKAFYESHLLDGPNMASITKQVWHDKGSLFPPYGFLHVRGGREEKGKHHSLINKEEAAVALALYASLVRMFDTIDFSFRVGVITPYKGQVGELRRQFRRRFGDQITSAIDFNTVDGFQGQEKDIIILSCVRGGTAEGSGIGFLSDTRRMNVALTRARSSLFVLGDSRALKHNEYWGKLIEDATERGLLREVDVDTFAGESIATPNTAGPANPRAKASKSKQADVSKRIMAAPVGLVKASESAKLGNPPTTATSPNTKNGGKARVPLAAKRKLSDSVKKEEGIAEDSSLPSAILQQKRPRTTSLLQPVKKEEPEDGEIHDEDAMSGVESSTGNTRAQIAVPAEAAPSMDIDRKPPTNTSQGGPVMVAPKKPVAASMFIQRKRPAIPAKRA